MAFGIDFAWMVPILKVFRCCSGTKASLATITISKALGHKMYLPPEFGQNRPTFTTNYADDKRTNRQNYWQ